MNIIYAILSNCSGDLCSVAQFIVLVALSLIALVMIPVGLIVVPTICFVVLFGKISTSVGLREWFGDREVGKLKQEHGPLDLESPYQ